jgi:uncharacterized membrane protein YfcA
MTLEPSFYAAAVPAVILTGLSKGGFGGSLAVLSLPLLALVISPVQAAGIMLPILLVMDAVAVSVWWRSWDKRNYVMLLPGALLGTAIGWATASSVEDGHIRLMLGVLGLGFLASQAWMRFQAKGAPAPRPPDWPRAVLWSTISGFTSFISHVGGPPFQIYLLPQRLPKEVFAGTATMYFATLNAVKLGPFWSLGQLSPGNLATSAVLLPIAVLATIAGARLVKRISAESYYGVINAVLAVVSVKLLWDGLQLVVLR